MLRCFRQSFPFTKSCFNSHRHSFFRTRSQSTLNSASEQQRNNILVATSEGVLKAVDHLSQCKEIAIDLEFDRNSYAYGFTLCLIQINGNNQTFIIDPLAPMIDISPLFRNILESSHILKVIHSPSEDLRLLQTLECYPLHMYDTERCAKLLNYSQTSLSFLLSEIIGVTINKKEQKSNWIKRPLTNSQLTYAANDVAHLLRLKDRLNSLVVERGVQHWVQDENDDWAAFRYEAKATTRLSAAKEERSLSPFQLHIYNALLGVREKYAEKLKKPPHFIIPKEPLFDSAKNYQTVRDMKLEKVSGAHKILGQEHVQRDFQRVFRSSKAQATELQLSRVVEREENVNTVQLEKYMSLKKYVADKYGANTANFILPRPILRGLANNHSHVEEITQPYRRELVRSLQKELNITSAAE